METGIRRFYYKRKILKTQLYTSVGYFVVGLFAVVSFKLTYLYFFLIIGSGFFIQYYLSKSKGYIRVDDKCLTKYQGWPKKIELKKITGIRYYVGDLTVLSETKKISIEKEFLEKEEFEALEDLVIATLKTNKSSLKV